MDQYLVSFYGGYSIAWMNHTFFKPLVQVTVEETRPLCEEEPYWPFHSHWLDFSVFREAVWPTLVPLCPVL
jgi:hypothetical protein